MQLLELIEREGLQVDRQVGDVVLDVGFRDEPLAGGQIDVLPPRHGHLADPTDQMGCKGSEVRIFSPRPIESTT